MHEGRRDVSAYERVRSVDSSLEYTGETFKTWPVYVDSVYTNGEKSILKTWKSYRRFGRKEIGFLQTLQGIRGVPRLIKFNTSFNGTVWEVREYIEGEDFFERARSDGDHQKL